MRDISCLTHLLNLCQQCALISSPQLRRDPNQERLAFIEGGVPHISADKAPVGHEALLLMQQGSIELFEGHICRVTRHCIIRGVLW